MDCTATLVSESWIVPQAPVNGVATDFLHPIEDGRDHLGARQRSCAAAAFAGSWPKHLEVVQLDVLAR